MPCVISGGTFFATLAEGLRGSKKVLLSVDSIESEVVAEDAPLKVPFWFDFGTSKVILSGASTELVNDVSTTEQTVIKPTFSDLPGLEDQLAQLSTCLERVNRQVEERYKHLAGCVPILLHGATGTGKSAILSQLAKQSGWKTITRLNQSDLDRSSSKVKTAITTAFAEASATQPSLIILDDLHITAGRQDENAATSSLLCEQLSAVKGRKVQIVATARRPIDLEQKLLSTFKKKIELPTPTPGSRRKILDHFSAGLVDDAILLYVAEKTHAYTATDLEDLCFAAFEAAETRTPTQPSIQINGIEESTNGVHYSDEKEVTINVNGVHASQESTPNNTHSASNPPLIPELTLADFQTALRYVHPSLMNELYIEVPKVHWSDIAGSAAVKSKIWEAVELPLKNPEIVSHLNLHLNHGILLYGPPGCSKTMTAKAIATESGLNFIAVKGPELVSKYVGESEYKIREIFRKARAASPSIIFFDEIDSIAPSREGGGGHEGLNTVATLLNEMDGVEDVQRVLVLAATNRPDAIDPALLRPGRLGTSLYVGPPSYEAVLQILQMRTDRMGNAKSTVLDLASIATKIIANGCYSGADVGALCDAAGMLCATEAVQKEMKIEEICLRQEHIEEALSQAQPSLNKLQLKLLQSWTVGRTN